MQNQSGPLLTTQVLAIIFSRSKHFYFLKALCRSYHQCHMSHRHRWSQPKTQDTSQIQIHPRIQEMKLRFNFQLISPSCSSMDQSWVFQKDSRPEIKLFLQNNILNKSIYGNFHSIRWHLVMAAPTRILEAPGINLVCDLKKKLEYVN